MNQHALSEYARDVAFVTLAMIEELQRSGDHAFPNGDPHHVFGGFMRFAAHAGEAGLALAIACDGSVSDAWIEIVDDYAGRVVRYALEHGCPASAATLARFAREARDDGSAEGGAP